LLHMSLSKKKSPWQGGLLHCSLPLLLLQTRMFKTTTVSTRVMTGGVLIASPWWMGVIN
jgi:hypothetical protein